MICVSFHSDNSILSKLKKGKISIYYLYWTVTSLDILPEKVHLPNFNQMKSNGTTMVFGGISFYFKLNHQMPSLQRF